MCMPAALHATSPSSKKPYNHSAGDEIFHFIYLYRDISSELLCFHNSKNSVCHISSYFCKISARGEYQHTFKDAIVAH